MGKDPLGFVHLRGAARKIGVSNLIGSLPVGQRPTAPITWFSAAATNGDSTARESAIWIDSSDGSVIWQTGADSPNGTFVSLDGITFQAG